MRAVHDPAVAADLCAGCVADPGGFDHVAVLAKRPPNFDELVLSYIREIAAGGPTFFGIVLNPGAKGMALTWLKENERPRPR